VAIAVAGTMLNELLPMVFGKIGLKLVAGSVTVAT
jgi:hypothetical protein